MKQFSFAIFFFTVSFLAKSQVDFGIKSGINLNQLKSDAYLVSGGKNSTKNSSVAFHVGVFVDISLNKRFSLTGEIQYSRRGDDFSKNANYLEIPIIATYKPIRIIGIQLGIGPGVFLSSESNYGFKSDLGLLSGINIKLSNRINFLVRYSYGLTPTILREPPGLTYNGITLDSEIKEIKAYNNAAQIGICVRLTNPK